MGRIDGLEGFNKRAQYTVWSLEWLLQLSGIWCAVTRMYEYCHVST